MKPRVERRRLERYVETHSWELSAEQKEEMRDSPLFLHPRNMDVYDPQSSQRVPKGGAWAMVTKPLPPMERDLHEKLRPGRCFWVQHEDGADDFGFLRGGEYRVLCRSPWADVKLWPYEYAVVPAADLVFMWQAGEVEFHQLTVSDAQFTDTMFYCMSRGIPRADAVVMSLGTLSGPVGWFEPKEELAAACEALAAQVWRWPILSARRRRRS